MRVNANGLQPVRINLDLQIDRRPERARDSIDDVVCYETLADDVRSVVETGHVNLVETLAERVAEVCWRDLPGALGNGADRKAGRGRRRRGSRCRNRAQSAVPGSLGRTMTTGETQANEDVQPLTRGIAELKRAVKRLPATPGVYRMVNGRDEVLYVGKARNLRHRVASYTQIARLSTRLRRMVAETVRLEIVTTHTEVEALLLEANMIKRLRPRYNITLRDDKSFPYILLNADHDWPRAVKYRGARGRSGEYFGPFASAGAVNRTLNTLERRVSAALVFRQHAGAPDPAVPEVSAETM